MIANPAIFTCSICGEASAEICAYCTKDACANHRCERCKRCSDCCECEVPLSAGETEAVMEPVEPPETTAFAAGAGSESEPAEVAEVEETAPPVAQQAEVSEIEAALPKSFDQPF
jgi:transcription elongation factor Elf1